MSVVIAALYKFVTLENHQEMRAPLLAECKKNRILGTLLLAHEGINGTIAGTRADIDQILAHLRSQPCFRDLEHKESFVESMPFLRMKVRLKKEIVTLGIEGINPNEKVGTYVDPQDWNELIQDPSVAVIDTRNDYEFELGTFKNAVNPGTQSFREFPTFTKNNLDPVKTPKVAIFCTGGIRCEKASAYLMEQGFSEVYQLKGGILKYLEKGPENESLWQGECFVFDQRIALDHNLTGKL